MTPIEIPQGWRQGGTGYPSKNDWVIGIDGSKEPKRWPFNTYPGRLVVVILVPDNVYNRPLSEINPEHPDYVRTGVLAIPTPNEAWLMDNGVDLVTPGVRWYEPEGVDKRRLIYRKKKAKFSRSFRVDVLNEEPRCLQPGETGINPGGAMYMHPASACGVSGGFYTPCVFTDVPVPDIKI